MMLCTEHVAFEAVFYRPLVLNWSDHSPTDIWPAVLSRKKTCEWCAESKNNECLNCAQYVIQDFDCCPKVNPQVIN